MDKWIKYGKEGIIALGSFGLLAIFHQLKVMRSDYNSKDLKVTDNMNKLNWIYFKILA
jgi:hypothetical protein